MVTNHHQVSLITSNFYHYDGNGNVTQISNSTGAKSATYRYDAFGNTLVATGPQAATNKYRFSTKPIENGSGLAYYGYRHYDSVSGRWPSRDPIGENGGILLYGALNNNAISRHDRLGLDFGGSPYSLDPNHPPDDPRPQSGCPEGQIKDPVCMAGENRDYERCLEDALTNASWGLGAGIVCVMLGGPAGWSIGTVTFISTNGYHQSQIGICDERYSEDKEACPCINIIL